MQPSSSLPSSQSCTESHFFIIPTHLEISQDISPVLQPEKNNINKYKYYYTLNDSV